MREVMQPLDAAGPPLHGGCAYAEESLRAIAYRMAATRAAQLAVVDPAAPHQPVGSMSLGDLLRGRALALDAGQRRERVLSLWPSPARGRAGGADE